ncbi:MAG: ATP phosphoribosyltransferase regulatory subunit, partial [Phascolarctobacterium sp.]|nr:ATP phosphoribosyltransferase regulatory subunit [Phascolarctobacterium sp.]
MQELAGSMEGITSEIKQLFADFLFLQGDVELLDKLASVVQNEKCLAALKDLRQIYELVEKHGAGKFVSFNLGLYRALDYYTGMLFEVYVPEMGYPVAGGGRYDKMMRGFGLDCPATGFAIGVDRVL